MRATIFLLIIVLLNINADIIRGSPFTSFLARSKRAGNVACGIPSQSTSLIVGGSSYQRGAWPWLVALLQKNKSPPKLFCGAVLVSQTKVLTGE